MDRPERPNWSVVRSMLGDLQETIGNLGEIQQRALAVTGTAWSPDRLVKAVVGPRGQLVELEIDPRVYRNPNSKALAATIVATVREAVEESAEKVKEIYEESIPADLRGGELDLDKLVTTHDTDPMEGR